MGTDMGQALGAVANPTLLAAHQVDALPESLPIIWSVKGPLRAQVLSTAPNAAHLAVRELQSYMEAKDGWLVVVTQNIDGLHERAGSTNFVELHGSVMRSRCSDPRCPAPAYYDETVPAPGGPLPACRCGNPLRPDVVLFGEAVPEYGMAQRAVLDAELLLVVGTSGQVQPAAGLVGLAALSGAYCVLVNAEPWENPDPDIDAELIGPAEVVLPALVATVQRPPSPGS
jgi:NAD-dependent deacetylase